MVGLLPGRSRMAPKLTLGYRLAEAAADSWLLREAKPSAATNFIIQSGKTGRTNMPAFEARSPR